MHRLPWLLVALSALAVPARADAEQPPNPLRLVPPEANAFLTIDRPGRFLESVTSLESFKPLVRLDAMREFLDSTNVRRFEQLIAYYERELGTPRMELLDKLAGGGLVLAARLGSKDTPVLLVVQARDEAILKKFVELASRVVEQELARQESKPTIEKGKYKHAETFRIGPNMFAARLGSHLLLSTTRVAIQKAIDQATDPKLPSLADAPEPAAARQLLPADPLAWGYFDLKWVHQLPGAKDVFATPRNDVLLTLFFGGWINVVGKADYLAFGLHREPKRLLATVRFPVRRAEMPADTVLHAPEKPLQAGSLPLLEPRGVLLSQSFYLDLAAAWNDREKIFNAKQVKELEKADKDARRFTRDWTLSKLLQQTGPHHRVVLAHRDKPEYAVEPGQKIPAGAFILSMRDPKFAESMDALLRGLGFFAGVSLGKDAPKLVEETVDEVLLVGYRFPETGKLPADVNNLRFNVTPCYAAVGDQFFVCSSLSLGRELIKLLKAEAKARAMSPRPMQMRFYSAGTADSVEASAEGLITQTILDRAVTRDEAKAQVKEIVAWLRQLGNVSLESEYADTSYRLDFSLTFGQ